MKIGSTEISIPFGRNYYSQTKKLLSENSDASKAYNTAIFNKVLWVGVLMSMFATLIGFFRPDMHRSQMGYLICGLIFLLMIHILGGKHIKINPLVGLYLFFTVFYGMVVYLSCFAFPTRYAATALTFFCVAPLVFVDTPLRVDLYELSLYFILTAMAYIKKPAYVASVDMVNCAISVILGIAIGRVMLIDRLESFDANRLLKLERETDVLTTLYNRRKLFDKIAAIESSDTERPDAVLMLDIDHFKEFNDTLGHAAGDLCLQAFGKHLTEEHSSDTEYYRYGGEEFVAFLYNCNEEDVADIADHIRVSTSEIKIEAGTITVSIGGIYCYDAARRNYEYWIDRADRAAYIAKSRGRNTVEIDTSRE